MFERYPWLVFLLLFAAYAFVSTLDYNDQLAQVCERSPQRKECQ